MQPLFDSLGRPSNIGETIIWLNMRPVWVRGWHSWKKKLNTENHDATIVRLTARAWHRYRRSAWPFPNPDLIHALNFFKHELAIVPPT